MYGVKEELNPNSLFLIKSANVDFPCHVGQILRCGSQIRLEHVSSGRNLNSEKFSPLINKEDETQEVIFLNLYFKIKK